MTHLTDYLDKMPVDSNYGYFETVYHHLVYAESNNQKQTEKQNVTK